MRERKGTMREHEGKLREAASFSALLLSLFLTVLLMGCKGRSLHPTTCPPAGLPFHLDIMVDGEDSPYGPSVSRQREEALVTYKRKVPYELQVGLLFLSDGTEVDIQYELPFGYEIPLIPGEIVLASVVKEIPWWTEYSVEISGLDGVLRGFARSVSNSYTGNPLCDPMRDSMECGRIVFPGSEEISIDPITGERKEVILYQGESILTERDHIVYKYFLCSCYSYVTMECTDFPNGWEDSAGVRGEEVSQSNCMDRRDCATGEVCETERNRCVSDARTSSGCDPGLLCDPYTGGCVDPSADSLACAFTSDCAQQAGTVCNTYLGRCQPDPCLDLDCAAGCSPLLGSCYECLSDADCPEGALCDTAERSCVLACNEARIPFPQNNPDGLSGYQVCVLGVVRNPMRWLAEVDALATCDASQTGSGCEDTADIPCTGNLDLDPVSGAVTDAGWERLCRLSMMPVVTGIHGRQ